MAIAEHTLPAPAGKAARAAQIISKMQNKLAAMTAGVRQLQDWPDQAALAEEAGLLSLVFGDIEDADISITMMLEVMAEKRD